MELPDAHFESQWEALLATARVDGAVACPASFDVNGTAVYDAAHESAAEELDDALEDGDDEIKVHKRGRGRPMKPPAEQVWEWLATMKGCLEGPACTREKHRVGATSPPTPRSRSTGR